jgi:hypothetical protein
LIIFTIFIFIFKMKNLVFFFTGEKEIDDRNLFP